MLEKQPSNLLEQIAQYLLPEKRSLADSKALKEYFQNSSVSFWGENTDALTVRFPDRDELIREANNAVEGKLRFWQPWHMEQTHTIEDMGDPITWDAAPNGDLEWTHALLRLYHILDLAGAYHITQNDIYLTTIEKHISSFCTVRFDEPKAVSDNLLDAALRIHHLIRTLDLIKNAENLSESLVTKMLAIIVEESEFLVERLRVKVGNWEFFITVALLMSSIYLSEICDVSKWRDEAEKRLNEILKSEILPDGNLIEACPMYHGQVVLLLLDYILVLISNNMEIPSDITTVTDKMLRALVRVVDPEGNIPRLGDSDSFAVAYITDYARHITGIEYYTAPPKPERLTVEDIKETGWLIYRFPLEEKSGYFLFDMSGKPPVRRTWHSHADNLQFLFHDGETDVFIDPGRFTYSSYFKKPLPFIKTNYKPVGPVGFLYHLFYPKFRQLNKTDWRAHFRHTMIHNTVCCDRKMQRGYTNLKEYPTLVKRLFHYQEGPLFMSGATLANDKEWMRNNTRREDSVRKESDEYEHTRTIIGYLPYAFVIIDKLTADKPHEWVSSYHVAPGIEINEHGSDVFELKTKQNKTHFLKLHSSDSTKLHSSIEQDWSSLVYNRREESQIIRASVNEKQSVTFISVIYPNLSLLPKDCYSKVIFSESVQLSPEIINLRVSTGDINIYLNEQPGKTKEFELVSTDAQVAILHEKLDNLLAVGIMGGSTVTFRNQEYAPESSSDTYFKRL